MYQSVSRKIVIASFDSFSHCVLYGMDLQKNIGGSSMTDKSTTTTTKLVKSIPDTTPLFPSVIDLRRSVGCMYSVLIFHIFLSSCCGALFGIRYSVYHLQRPYSLCSCHLIKGTVYFVTFPSETVQTLCVSKCKTFCVFHFRQVFCFCHNLTLHGCMSL